MKRVIINGDDYGYTPEKCAGILRSHREGILTSTTVMINVLTDEWRDSLLECRESLGIGLHLNITFGKPLSAPDRVRTLLNNEGRMFRPQVWTRAAWDEFGDLKNPDEVELEFRAQIRRFEDRLAMRPSHLDSHHFSASHPMIFPIYLRVAREYRLPVRLPAWTDGEDRFLLELSMATHAKKVCKTPDHGIYEFYCNGTDPVGMFREALVGLGEGTTEFMFHPSVASGSDRKSMQGRTDLDVLTNAEVKRQIVSEGIHLINYGDL